jgi:hypothetical protein
VPFPFSLFLCLLLPPPTVPSVPLEMTGRSLRVATRRRRDQTRRDRDRTCGLLLLLVPDRSPPSPARLHHLLIHTTSLKINHARRRQSRHAIFLVSFLLFS